MKRFTKNLPEFSQRGDSGTIYIVFIMFIIICASFVMVGGLNPEFDNLEAQQNAQSGFYDDPNDKLPPLPNPGTPEYERMQECAAQARKGLSNKEIAEGKRMPIDSDCPQSSLL